MRHYALFVPVAALVATLATPQVAHAHFIWALLDGGQVRFALLESPAQKPDTKFGSYVEGLKATLPLGVVVAGSRSGAVPAGLSVVGAETTVGVKSRDGVDYLLRYHAKAALSLEAASKPTNAPVELIASQVGEQLVVTALQDGWPVPATEVTLHLPGSDDTQAATTDISGSVRFPLPHPQTAGYLGLRAKIVAATPGELTGKKYAQVHHWATLTVPVAVSKPAESFSRVLRAALSVHHDTVEKAAFNTTLFQGKLTRPQLEVHLQQRALVHNEVHRILTTAAPRVSLPYGSAQKNILTLLFSDLIALGSGWPTEVQARPRTRAFLEELRASEAQGPYFALGVQHVYYGGITNGGRMIGQRIAETVGCSLTYYAKSDGYRDYLTLVDGIVAPEARAEMLRGSQAAYRYIIDTSNEEIFK